METFHRRHFPPVDGDPTESGCILRTCQIHHRLLHWSTALPDQIKRRLPKKGHPYQPTDCHAYFPNSPCHPCHVVQNIPYSQFLGLRRLCADTEVFNVRCDEMEGQFLRRGYHLKNVQEAPARVRNIPALRRCSTSPNRTPTERPSLSHTTRPSRTPTERPCHTHHPSNPPLVHGTPNLRPTHQMEYAAGAPPPSRPWGAQLQVAAITIHAVLLPSPPDTDPGYFRCDKLPCFICTSHSVETLTFNSSTTKESFQIRHRLTCQSSNIVYLLYCDTCEQSRYVGETKNTLKTDLPAPLKQKQKHRHPSHRALQTDHGIHNMN